MKWTKVISDGKGGYNIFDNWTNGDDLGSALLPFILRLPLIMLFSLLIPGVLWIIAPLEEERDTRANTKIGILASILTLLDFSLGGPMWTILSDNGAEISAGHMFFGTINLAFLFCNIVILRLYATNIVVVPNVLLVIQGVFLYISYDIFNYLATLMYSDSICFWMQAWVDLGNAS
tara:strand:+ start:453 stop:980 length:528 start_codon:yes stop_codon:yes gene_type:complete